MKRYYIHLALAVIFASGLVLSVQAAEPAKPIEASKDDTSGLIEPSINYVRVNGNAAKFREDTWMNNGWTGGIQEFELHRKVGKDVDFNMEGRVIFNADDYKLRLELIKPEYWFVRGGLTTYQKYFNPNGGYFAGMYSPTNTSSAQFALGTQDLTLNMRNFFFEAGILRPNLPKVTIGYERQEKQGLKSSLEWGTLSWTNTLQKGTTAKRIYPSFKSIDEHTDIARVEIEHDIKNIHIGNEFRYERYQSLVGQYNGGTQYLPPFNTTPPYGGSLARTNSTVTYYDSQQNDLFWNTFHVESQLNEKVFWSLGYLFTTVDGDAGFIQDSYPKTIGATEYYTTKVNLNSDSHVLNGNLMVDICKNLTGNVGLQAEATDETAFQTAVLATNQTPTVTAGRGVLYLTNYQKRSLEEEFGLRWTAIPYTTVFAEAKLGQEQSYIHMDMNTNVAIVATHRLRDTEVNTQTRDFKVGFNSAPLPRTTLSGHYRRGNREDDFGGYTGNLASFLCQSTDTDEVAAKLTLRPSSLVSMSLKYQYVRTDISTTSLATNMTLKANTYLPTDSGRYEANIYTFSTTVMPVPRLYVTGLFQYQDTSTASQYFGQTMMAPYRADVFTMAANAGFALDNKTDLMAEYSFTYTDNLNSDIQAGTGYSFGIDSRRHGIQVGVRRQLAKNMVGNLRYGFFEYVEDSTGGINNYRANVVSASCSIRF